MDLSCCRLPRLICACRGCVDLHENNSPRRGLTVFGVVLVVGAVPELPVLGAPGAPQLAIAEPHGELRPAGHRRAVADLLHLLRCLNELCAAHSSQATLPHSLSDTSMQAQHCCVGPNGKVVFMMCLMQAAYDCTTHKTVALQVGACQDQTCNTPKSQELYVLMPLTAMFLGTLIASGTWHVKPQDIEHLVWVCKERRVADLPSLLAELLMLPVPHCPCDHQRPISHRHLMHGQSLMWTPVACTALSGHVRRCHTSLLLPKA